MREELMTISPDIPSISDECKAEVRAATAQTWLCLHGCALVFSSAMIKPVSLCMWWQSKQAKPIKQRFL